jgi:hypothetical protein
MRRHIMNSTALRAEKLKNIATVPVPYGAIFCCEYAVYFWEAVKIRYPEYILKGTRGLEGKNA